MRPYRVVQWGTGWAGRQAIPGVLAHPDLELVGVYVTSDEKHGRDAGALAGIDPTGVLATTDVEEIMGLGADCHLFMLQGHRPKAVRACVERMSEILAAGQNVCQTSVVPLYYPEYAPPEIREPIAAACAAGGSRCYSTGVYPGVMSDIIPMALLAGCERVDCIRVTEILNYVQYYGAAEAKLIGIGGPMDAALPMAERVAAGTMTLVAAGIHHLAERLGVTLDEVRTGDVEVAPAHERAEVEGHVIEPGTFGALRHVTQGWAAGRPVIEFAFVTRYDDAAAPEWPRARGGYGGCYRIEVDGSLSLDVDVNLVGHRASEAQTSGFATSSAQLGAYLMTTAPAINAIPFLCRAEPGLYGSMDLDRGRDLHVLADVPIAAMSSPGLGASPRSAAETLAILEPVQRYGFVVDECDWDGFARVFTEDAVFDARDHRVDPPVGWAPLLGRDEIVRAFRDVYRHPLQHMLLVHVIDDVTDDEVIVRSKGIFPLPDFEFFHGVYHDTVVRTPDGWRIRLKRFTPAGTDVSPWMKESTRIARENGAVWERGGR